MSTAITDSTTIVATPRHTMCRLKDEVAILDMETGRYFGLNAVGSAVWELLQEPTTMAQMRCELERRYDVSTEVLARDLAELVERLAQEKLIRVEG